MTPRKLHAGEAEAIAALVRDAFRHLSVEPDPPPSARRESADAVRAILVAGGGAGIEGGQGRLIACVLWEPKPPGLYMGRLAVDPAWRGQGLARCLVAEAESAARAAGHAVLWLSTRLVLQDNRRFFASCGFSEGAMHAHEGYATPTFLDMIKVIA